MFNYTILYLSNSLTLFFYDTKSIKGKKLRNTGRGRGVGESKSMRKKKERKKKKNVQLCTRKEEERRRMENGEWRINGEMNREMVRVV